MNHRKPATTYPPKSEQIDWFRVCADIKKYSGLSYMHMADLLGVSRSHIEKIRDGKIDPRYLLGQRLLKWQSSLSAN